MITFFVLSALLVALTLGVLGWSVLRAAPSGEGAPPAQRDANVAIAREQLHALDRARDAGDLDAAAYADERERLERSLAASLDAAPATRGHRGAAIGAAALIGVAVPIATGVLYLELGQPEALVLGPQSRGAGTEQASAAGGGAAGGSTAAPSSGGSAQASAGAAADGAPNAQAPALDELLPELEARLADRPDDLEGWSLLGRTYLNVQRYDKAADALEHASGLAPNDVNLLTALAEARAMRAGGSLTGDALPPLESAVELDPMHEQGLWLLGIARQQANEHDAAIELLTRLRGIAVGSGNAQAVATIDEYLSTSRSALGLAPIVPGSEATPLAVAPAETPGGRGDTERTGSEEVRAAQSDSATGNAITIDVSLSEDARSKVDAAQSVFVFARAADGPPMPLAVARLTVADLPATVRLDETMAMLPTMTLGTFPEVTVGARVSASGQPAAASGDWFDEQEGVAPADGPQLDLVIDRQVP